jgi:hypothetical protein
LETTVTDENSGHEEIKWRLNSGNACYHSVQNMLSSRLLSKIIIKIYRTNFAFHDTYCSPSKIKTIKSRSMKIEGYAK